MAAILRVINKGLSGQPAISYRFAKLATSSTDQQTNADANMKTEYDEIEEIMKTRTKDMPEATIENPYKPPKCRCILCEYNVTLDYKNPKLLSQFISQHTGQLYNKSVTGLCEKQYERIKAVIVSSKAAGFMPFVYKDFAYLKDPNICNKRGRR